MNRSIFFVITILLIFAGSMMAQTGRYDHHAQAPLNCSECHSCNNPTYEKPCLKILPDFKRQGLTIYHTADEAPDIFVIDTLSRIYEPTVFTHRLHAEMAFMSGGCASCHHFNPPGKILACADCHEAKILRTDLSKPGLKGAYHQQCLNCHREWSHSTNCIVCHAEKGQEGTGDKSEFRGKAHQKIETPGKLVYQTEYDENPVVTFYHNSHTNMYGLKCTDCHTEESCGRCHDTMKRTRDEDLEAHDNCINCHQQEVDDDCGKCHDVKEKKAFSHKDVGWELNRYHISLDCNQCHKSGKFTRLSKKCTSCHKNWQDGKINHRVTGVALDEMHADLECSDCHTDMDFAVKPFCNDCHENYSYPSKVPGKIVRN